MCGIAGILTADVGLDLAGPLARMRRALGHRGPDGDGAEELRLPGGLRLGLAHTRLAILDLSPAGRQPMADPATGSAIVYNGEVYNHAAVRTSLPPRPYVSTCDTETILAGWVDREDRLLPSLRGMFAFGVYDAPRRRFWLVRDRLGVKPLYAARRGDGTWLFASEVRALLASGLVGRTLDAAAVESYLAFGSVVAPRTLLREVESLLPGECWRFDLDGPAVPTPVRSRYWRLPFSPRPEGAGMSREEAVEAVRPVLREAVDLRMLSDVPVGVFLSGGIDSSAIVATLAAGGRGVTTLSVAFEERSHDESAFARVVARRYGTRHVELLLRSDKILREFVEALDAYDQPSVDGLNSYFVSQTARESGVPVALSGLGGDELFAGYPYFRYAARAERPAWRRVGRLVGVAAGGAGGRGGRIGKLAALFDARKSRLDRYLTYRTLSPSQRRSALLRDGAGDGIPGSVRAELDAAVAGLDPVNAHSLLELSLYTANTLLRDADQMSMAHALEVRVPLLDHILVETAARIPGGLKLSPGRSGRLKGLLTDALPEPLPAEVTGRRKMGFVLPWGRWLRHELHGEAEAILRDREAAEAAGLDPSAVVRRWEEFRTERAGRGAGEILGLANLVRWCRRNVLGRV